MTYKEKIKYYCDLAVQTEKEAVASRSNWMSILDTSAKMYKYSFADQLMIHTQHPNAIACAPIDTWNKSFSRFVRRGTKGIALLDTSSGRPKLNYVFDVNDTEVYKSNTPTVNIWQFKTEHEPLVLSQLAKIYDDVDLDSGSISDNFHNIANQLATEYYEDNAREISLRVENSFLEDFDDDNLRVAFINTVSVSMAYVLIKRCGYDVNEYFTEEDFDNITDFSSADALYALGEAVSDLSEQVLRDVELVVKKHEKQKANELAQNRQLAQTQNIENERIVENERINQQHRNIDPTTATNLGGEIRDGIRSSGGLSSAEHSGIGADRGRGTAFGQIRSDEEGLLKTASQDNLRNDGKSGNTVPSLPGNGGIGGSEIVASNDGTNSQSQLAEQGIRPNGMGDGNEYAETSSRGTDTERTDSRLHLNDNETQKNTENPYTEQVTTGYSQLGTTFGNEVISNAEPPKPTEKLAELLSTSSINIDEVDFILRDGGNDRNSILRLTANLAKDLPIEANAEFIKEEYLKGRYKHHSSENGGKGFKFGDKEVSVWFTESGLEIGRGKSVHAARDSIQITWEQAAERMRQLYNAGNSVNHDVLDEALHNEYVETAESLLDLYRDDFRDFREVPENWGWGKKGWPDAVAHITDLLKEKDGEYKIILERLTADVAALELDPSVRTRFYHNPQQTLQDLEKLAIEPKGFPIAKVLNMDVTRFITNDEIDSRLTKGSVVSEGKMRIFSHFLNNHTSKENTSFLKDEYGHGGGSWGHVWGGWQDATPSTGIKLRRKDCEDVNLRWEAVSNRISQLIKSGQYMTQAELDRIPLYEKIILARQINNFFRELPDGEQYLSPFSNDLDFYYPKQAELEMLRTFTENEPSIDGTRPIGVCLEKMQYIFDNTSIEDRYYNLRKFALDNLTAFRDGKFTLFPNVDRIVTSNQPNRKTLSLSGFSSDNTSRLPFSQNIFFTPAQTEQLTLFGGMTFPQLPSVHEQQAIIESKEAIETKEVVVTTAETVANTHFAVSENVTDEIETIETELDFDTIAEWALESVLNDNTYLEELANAKNRSSMRNACSVALNGAVIELANEWTEVYQAYYNNDDFNDKLFDYVLRQSWEQRPITEVQEVTNISDNTLSDEVATDISAYSLSAEETALNEPDYAERFEISVTSDAYDEIEPYAIWDNENERTYVDDNGDIPTFEVKDDAYAFLAELRIEHAKDKTSYISFWDEFVNIVKTDLDNVESYSEPIVLIEHSESPRFKNNERLTFAVADQKFKDVEAEILAEREEKPSGYKKTNGTIFYKADPSDTELSTYSFRYDIGDYTMDKSGLYNHINNRITNIEKALNNPLVPLHNTVTQGYKYTQSDVDDVKHMLSILDESLHVEKALEADKIIISPASEVTATPSVGSIDLTKPIINAFTGADKLLYAKANDNSIYISDGYFIMKIDTNNINDVAEKINARRRKDFIKPVEMSALLTHMEKANGNFQLTTQPHELPYPQNDKMKFLVFADDKQYFSYNKKYVGMFQSSDGNTIDMESNPFKVKFFVDDNSSYEIGSHNLIAKDESGGVLGLILPIITPEILYEQLADVLPLEIPYKNELARARENPTHDPYIGREFFDGKGTHFISKMVEKNGENNYIVPLISYDENGENPTISQYAIFVKTTDMEQQIKQWESYRISSEQQKIDDAVQAQKDAITKADYENVNGYGVDFLPMQQARAVKVLNDMFNTKDYGNISLKKFVETAVKNGNAFKIVTPMKKKYQEMDAGEYFREIDGRYGGARADIEARSNYNKASRDYDTESQNAKWLKENHPFLHYCLFRDESVLDSSYFNTEYRVYMDDSRFYDISKTAYDYGNYLIDSDALNQEQTTDVIDITDISLTEPKTNSKILPESLKGKIPNILDKPLDLEQEQVQNQEQETQSANPTTTSKPLNFRITDDNLGHGGAKTKFKANIDAIKTLQTIETENRYATPEEQEILARYVGWGSLQEAFDETKEQWANEFAELSLLLTNDEYKSAKGSVLNAHYTSPIVIKSMYETLERMGFRTGNLLEPSAGVGNFLGLLPDSMNNAKVYGVEIDSISARIAKQLYPSATIKEMGYEKTDYPDNFFDIAVGNVPFGDYGVADKKYDKHKLKIHDYFFTKTLDQVRPGGIIAFVTSKGTLDKQNPEVRKYLAQRAELLGAVRLPNTAFKANAGTEVTSDIIFLQKRDRIIDAEPDWVYLGQIEDAYNTENQISVNRYFADNPEMILGQMTSENGSRMYGNAKIASCVPFETMPDGSPSPSLAEQLQKAMLNIEGQITTPEVSVDIDDLDASPLEAIPADPDVKNFSFTVVEDVVYFRENSMMYPVEQPATTLERIKGMVGLRDCVRELINMQVDENNEFVGEVGEQAIKQKQAELDILYNKFNKEFGRINATANSRAFATGQFSDNAYYLLCSLEIFDEDGNFKRKGDMFTKRTIKQKIEITHVDTSTEALAVSMGEKAKVDVSYMAQLTGFTPEKIMQDLKGVIYCDITSPNRAIKPFDPAKMKIYEKYPLVTADEFLSGNIRLKLERAKQFYEIMPDEIPNIDVDFTIKSLEAAMPKELEAHEISFRLGSTWIAAHYVQQFMYELLQTSAYNKQYYQVNYHSTSGEWNVSGKGKSQFNDIPANVTYGTKRANAYEIIHDTLNMKDVRVYDYSFDEHGNKTRELNKKETAIAQQKQEQIKALFKDWVFKDPERRQTLVKLYNEKFNSTRPREYDGGHITFSGISPEISLREHQLNAIAHILYGGNTLLAHEVGAGKTFEIVAAAMESKRLGLTNKSLIAVPNHLTEQWGSEWLRLYPSANILVATKKDFEPRNRKKFIAKIATGSYDAVIIGHTQLEKIPLSKERQERILQEQLDEIIMGIEEVEASKGDRFTIKQMERTRKSVELKIQKLADGKKRDNVVTFEELGCDRLYVDESHFYKNLMLITKMRNVAGLSSSDAQKSTDLFMKCRFMDELTTKLHGRPCGTVFASGTPISNSISELYTIQRYLQYDVLVEQDFTHFDAWASTFSEPETSIELAPDNSGYRARTRLATFHNLPELMTIFKDVADIKTADMLDLPVPTVVYETIVAKPSDLQKEMVQDLSERAGRVQRRVVDPRTDNMLKITTDGRKIGLDQRLINNMLPDFEGSKVNTATNNIFQIWEETKEERLTQLCFCDFSTPNKDGRFNVYEDIKSKLIERGIPEHELVFIHDATTETQKKELFAKVRKGKVRVLFGSTAKMGAGTNVQDKLYAIHDIDCPWRPADLEQRRGRIVRQGNNNKEVKIFRYATEATFDAYLWQTVQKKQEFIAQIMTSKSPVRSCEDVDETALSYAEIKALCAGNPLIAEKMRLDVEVAKLRMGKAEHLSQHYRLEDSLLKTYPMQIASTTERITGIETDIKLYEKHNITSVEVQGQNSIDGGNIGAVSVSAKFAGMVINGNTYTEKEPAGKALLDLCKVLKPKEVVKIGEYMGFEMSLSMNASSFGNNLELLLKGAITHRVELGSDTFGNITRINNELTKLPDKLNSAKADLDVWKTQQQAAKDELTKPFHLALELEQKEVRLTELNIQLNIENEQDVSESVDETNDPKSAVNNSDTLNRHNEDVGVAI